MFRLAIPAALVLALAAPAATSQTAAEAREQARLDKALEGLTPGKPDRCIPRDRVTRIETFQDTILYVQGRGRLWRNTTDGGCSGLRHGDMIVWRGSTGQYCRGDIIETRSRGGGYTTGGCSLGDFVPYGKGGSEP